MTRAALLDLDGTLVDANYQHAYAWFRALRRFDITVPMWLLHRHIGMGGDQYVKAVAGEDVERDHGDELRDAHTEEFQKLRDECMPLPGVRAFLEALREDGLTIVLASSSEEDDLKHFLDLLDARDLVDGWTSADDVENAKPEPDVIHAALEQAGADEAVLVGDSRWDVEAAAKAGVRTICVLTGGWADAELRDAGAVAVAESLEDLTAKKLWRLDDRRSSL